MVTPNETPGRRKLLAGSVVFTAALALAASQWRLCSSSHEQAELTAARSICFALRGRDSDAVDAARQAMRRSATPTIAFAAHRVDTMIGIPLAERAATIDPDVATTAMQRRALEELASRLAGLDDQCEGAP